MPIVRHFNSTQLGKGKQPGDMENSLRVAISVLPHPFGFPGLLMLDVSRGPALDLLAWFPRNLVIVDIINVIRIFVGQRHFGQRRGGAAVLLEFAGWVLAALVPVLEVGRKGMLFLKLGFFSFQRRGKGPLFNDLDVLFYRLGRQGHRQADFELKVVLVILGLEEGSRLFIELGFGGDALLAAHLLKLEVELLVADAVNGLLLGLPLEQGGEQVLEHVLHSVVPGALAVLQLFLVDFKFGPGFDLFLFRLLAECGREVRLIVIRVFPELAIEHVPLLLDAALLPVLSN